LTDDIERSQTDPVLVHGLLIAFLGLLNIDLEFAVEFLEVSD
jgi:hypothetical protein